MLLNSPSPRKICLKPEVAHKPDNLHALAVAQKLVQHVVAQVTQATSTVLRTRRTTLSPMSRVKS